MADSFLVKKWNYAFNTFFDTNKSKVLEWDDFQLLIDKIGKDRGTESDAYKTATTAMQDIWRGLITFADTNKDNRVSLDEWQHMWKSVASERKFPEWQDAYLKYMFKLLDSSGDGLIDLAEYIGVMGMYGLPKEHAQEVFRKFAIIQGKPVDAINFDQFKELWTQYFLATDPSLPGNFLFGNIP